MKLFLVRHAIAGVPDPEQWPNDRLRPLTSKGSRRFKKAARGIVTLFPEVDALFTSPLVRARQTADILCDAGWPEPEVIDELVHRETGVLLRALQPHKHLDAIALVGHEDLISRFAAAALGSNSAPWREMKKGGVAVLECSALGFTGGATLSAYLPPRVLRAISKN